MPWACQYFVVALLLAVGLAVWDLAYRNRRLAGRDLALRERSMALGLAIAIGEQLRLVLQPLGHGIATGELAGIEGMAAIRRRDIDRCWTAGRGRSWTTRGRWSSLVGGRAHPFRDDRRSRCVLAGRV